MPRIRRALLFVILGLTTRITVGQAENPVYVDDSPRARELFQRAADQTADNEGEAVRIYQELLDEYPEKLVPRSDHERNHLVAVRPRVLGELRANASLLERYQTMQRAEARRMLEAGELQALALTRSLTGAGLEALLRLAQDDLESARFHAARRWLDEARSHPDLAGRNAVHCWFMLGVIAHYLDEPVQVDACVSALAAIGGPAETFLEDLRQLGEQGKGPELLRGRTTLETGEASDLADLVGQTIWSADLQDALINRRFTDTTSPTTPRASSFDRRRRDGDLSTVAPTLARATVFVNEGHTVRALDRLTGRDVWPQPYSDGSPPAFTDRDSDATCDMNLIAIHGNDLVTLTGHAHPTTRSAEGRVVCLDARTGVARWTRSLNRIGDDDEHAGLFPYGAPIIFEGTVCVLARKLTRQSLTGCYVVALDLTDGQLRWIRHVASSGGRSRAGRAFSTLVRDGGTLYVASAVGAIASIEAASGSIRWLRRYAVPVRPRDRLHRPWELGSPVVVDDVVIALTPDRRRVIALDRATGDEVRSADASAQDRWNAPTYLLAVGEIIYGVGEDVRAFHATDLTQPLWTYPPPATTQLQPADEIEEIAPASISVVGRVQAVDDAIIVPAQEGLFVLDSADGALVRWMEIDAAGNPLAVGGQLMMATADRLEVYMSLDRAEVILRDRLVENPEDPEPGLSLVRLASRVENVELAVDAAQLTLQAIERSPSSLTADASRDGLLSLLLELHAQGLPADDALADRLYATIGTIAATPEQRVRHLLAYAEWLGERSPERAIDVLQQIAVDPVLATTPRIEAGRRRRPAARAATDAMSVIVARHGRAAYAASAQRADTALSAARASGDVDALVAVARMYPLADAAVDAARTAASRRRAAGDARGAMAALLSTYRLSPEPERASPLLGAAVDMLIADGQRDEAARLLRDVIGRHGTIEIETSQGPRDATAWLRELVPDGRDRLPRVGHEGGNAREIGGRLLPRAASAGPASPEHVYMIAGDRLTKRTVPTLEPAWTTPLDESSVELLHESPTEILLWARGDQNDDPRVMSIDAATGTSIWSTTRLDEIVEAPLARERGIQGNMPSGRHFEPKETLAALGDDTIHLVQRTGGVATFDRWTGDPIWTLDRTLEQVHFALANGGGLVLVGLARPIDEATGPLRPRILVIEGDGASPVVRRLEPSSATGILWVQADAMGVLYCATPEGIEAIDLLTGDALWTCIAPEVQESRRGWMGSRRLYVETRAGNLAALDPTAGWILEPYTAQVRGEWDAQALTDVIVGDDRVTAVYSQRVVRYTPEGEIVGADVIDDARDYRRLLVSEDDLVVLSLFDARQVAIKDQIGKQQQWTYRIYVLSENGMLLGAPIQLRTITRRLIDAALVDGWLVLSADAETFAVPLPR